MTDAEERELTEEVYRLTKEKLAAILRARIAKGYREPKSPIEPL